jgi:hypothetical protein
LQLNHIQSPTRIEIFCFGVWLVLDKVGGGGWIVPYSNSKAVCVIFLLFQKPLCDALCAMAGNKWPDHMRAGIVAILQNRVGTVLVLLLHDFSFKLPTILHSW